MVPTWIYSVSGHSMNVFSSLLRSLPLPYNNSKDKVKPYWHDSLTTNVFQAICTRSSGCTISKASLSALTMMCTTPTPSRTSREYNSALAFPDFV
ncbi:hypothetical protein ACN38_g8865 [Penicillium nordicum]|uniref:Uncharacterized protein n=1 Tax=Penicillium nordicum TaxID=229535 RepID=A0A0M8NWI8_9EURO|nr:hypothetical protein ACN38_g8865 [Penicillium nordicum]